MRLVCLCPLWACTENRGENKKKNPSVRETSSMGMERKPKERRKSSSTSVNKLLRKKSSFMEERMISGCPPLGGISCPPGFAGEELPRSPARRTSIRTEKNRKGCVGFNKGVLLGWRQDNGNRSNQESKFDFLATRQCLVKIDEGQQKIKIVRTNRQSNLRCSCQSIFSLCRHHPSVLHSFFSFFQVGSVGSVEWWEIPMSSFSGFLPCSEFAVAVLVTNSYIGDKYWQYLLFQGQYQ